MKDSERGSITMWMLGLSLLILLFGGLALDYWRALALQRELAAIADSAALAAASGIDEEHYRSTGELILDPDRSRTMASASINWQGADLVSQSVDVDVALVTVEVEAAVELGLLGVFVDQDEPLTVRATASAVPVFVP